MFLPFLGEEGLAGPVLLNNYATRPNLLCYNKHMSKLFAKKSGDTLIEVTLAVGIFSMVVVAVVSVMNGGTNSAQTALETTLTRQSIDTQAEALRFIQGGVIQDKTNGTDGNYTKLWREITKSDNVYAGTEIQNFGSEQCKKIYNGTLDFNSFYAFVIDPKQLSTLQDEAPNLDKIRISLINTGSNQNFFSPATYPRIVYNGDNSPSAEGLFVVAVPEGLDNSSATYYDFYIRTCWYSPGSSTPSTISTIIRLYDPIKN